MPFVFGLIILMTLRSVVFGEMSNVVDLFAVFSYFGPFSIGSFCTAFTPTATVSIRTPRCTSQPFTPLLLGTKQIANFRESSYPELGAYLLCVSVLLIMLAGWFSRKEVPR